MDFIKSFIGWVRQDGEFDKLNLQINVNEPDENLMILKCPSDKRYRGEFMADNKNDTVSVIQPNRHKDGYILADDYYDFLRDPKGVF